MTIEYGNNIKFIKIISVFISVFVSLSAFCQYENTSTNLDYKEVTIDEFCILINDSLTLYRNKNLFKREHTSQDLYMIALIANTIEIYSQVIITNKCILKKNFYDYDEWINNILMIYSKEVKGYRGLMFFKNKEKCNRELVFFKIRKE